MIITEFGLQEPLKYKLYKAQTAAYERVESLQEKIEQLSREREALTLTVEQRQTTRVRFPFSVFALYTHPHIESILLLYCMCICDPSSDPECDICVLNSVV